ncbi:MAG: DNA adenine methylase, partial [Candidatus Aenigmarchaeota archaeon]|nr:DNA adenine methylase [Candidatus Aenigmarchaeota archaeon]
MSIIEESRKYAELLEPKPELGPAATFVPNKAEPVYNWLYYKEGFSKQLVFWLLDFLQVKKGSLVLDPFCGVGTTLLACKQRGMRSIGCDVQPVGVFASRVKTRDYNIEELRQQAKELLRKKFVRLQKKFPPLFYKAFSRYALEDIAFFEDEIKKMEGNAGFFLLALINAAIKCSYAWKDGAVIKIRKSPKP